MVNCMVFLSSEIVQKKKKTRRKILQASRGKNSTRFTEKKNPIKCILFCHREEKTIEHNILGKGDRIQKIRFQLEGI